MGDVWVFLEGPEFEGLRAHVACTAEGVRRWNREGQPHESPLDWSRYEQVTWFWPRSDRSPHLDRRFSWRVSPPL
jgi:hypothetical protein